MAEFLRVETARFFRGESMKTFYCDSCGNLVFFDNVECVRCGHALGFLPGQTDMSALEPARDRGWWPLNPVAQGRLHRSCSNGESHHICNWLVPATDRSPFCVACRLNDVIPDLAVAGNLERWRKIEAAKRRLVYTLLRLGLPMNGAPAENRPPLRFCFLGNPASGPKPLTGHSHGEITVNIAEADDDERERLRVRLHEPYRTLLGHLRHEIAHYYWEQLISGTPRLTRFREVFGSEELDYDAALHQYYEQGPPADWQSRHITAYGSSHPWEDWAETWAHYLHIVDTVETAAAFGISLNPTHPSATAMTADPAKAAGPDTPFDTILEHWLPLTCALNSLNRGMGLLDLYPFVLSKPAIEKLRFVHQVICESRANSGLAPLVNDPAHPAQ